MSRLGFEPRTRGLKVRLSAVHGVVSGQSACVSRAAPIHRVHHVVWDAFPVAGSVAGRRQARTSHGSSSLAVPEFGPSSTVPDPA